MKKIRAQQLKAKKLCVLFVWKTFVYSKI